MNLQSDTFTYFTFEGQVEGSIAIKSPLLLFYPASFNFSSKSTYIIINK